MSLYFRKRFRQILQLLRVELQFFRKLQNGIPEFNIQY